MKGIHIIGGVDVIVCLMSGEGVSLADQAHVTIQQVEERTQAIVTSPAKEKKEAMAEPVSETVLGTIAVVEDGTVDVLDASSDLVGEGADKTVEAVQTAGDSAFSWLFKALDFRNWRANKE